MPTMMEAADLGMLPSFNAGTSLTKALHLNFLLQRDGSLSLTYVFPDAG